MVNEANAYGEGGSRPGYLPGRLCSASGPPVGRRARNKVHADALLPAMYRMTGAFSEPPSAAALPPSGGSLPCYQGRFR